MRWPVANCNEFFYGIINHYAQTYCRYPGNVLRSYEVYYSVLFTGDTRSSPVNLVRAVCRIELKQLYHISWCILNNLVSRGCLAPVNFRTPRTCLEHLHRLLKGYLKLPSHNWSQKGRVDLKVHERGLRFGGRTASRLPTSHRIWGALQAEHRTEVCKHWNWIWRILVVYCLLQMTFDY